MSRLNGSRRAGHSCAQPGTWHQTSCTATFEAAVGKHDRTAAIVQSRCNRARSGFACRITIKEPYPAPAAPPVVSAHAAPCPDAESTAHSGRHAPQRARQTRRWICERSTLPRTSQTTILRQFPATSPYGAKHRATRLRSARSADGSGLVDRVLWVSPAIGSALHRLKLCCKNIRARYACSTALQVGRLINDLDAPCKSPS